MSSAREPSSGIRIRAAAPSRTARVHYAPVPQPPRLSRTLRQRLRIQQFQRRWQNIREDLPPQLSRRHIGMISIGGVIGTGLFLGSATSLHNGGPVGALLGYSVIGTVVYCLCVSIGEMIAFLPNVGGVVGLADLYVDKALGFSLGWAAWYNWSVTLPAEVTAAAIVVKFWDQHNVIPSMYLSLIFLFLAIGVNCFSTRIYGEFEFWFSTIKVVTIILIIIVCLILDLGAGKEGFIGFKKWSQPFSKVYLGIEGPLGQFLGFWAVLMQASFSFFGSEVPGIAAGEVMDAARNVPKALQRVWIRIILFYVGGIFCAGLLVSVDDPQLTLSDGTASSSPFVIALDHAGVKVFPHIINAAILLSAWSAAASDIYISSRFLFFLARCHHAPQFLASLVRYPWQETTQQRENSDDEDLDDDENDNDSDELPVINITRHSTFNIDLSASDSFHGTSDVESGSKDDDNHRVEVQMFEVAQHNIEEISEESPHREKAPYIILPLAAILVSSSVGFLCLLGVVGNDDGGAQIAFNWLVAVASVASLQSWAGLLFTYIRWHQGTVYAEKKHKVAADIHEESRKVIADIEKIKVHRHKGQPYLAWYAFIICMVVIFTNGWTVFVNGGWKIAEIPDLDTPPANPAIREADPISQFLASYVPIPFFLLLTFGYKLIHQTKMVKLEEMQFERVNVPEVVDDQPKSRREGFLRWLLVL